MAERVTSLLLEYDYGETPATLVTHLSIEYDWVIGPPGMRATQLYLEYDYVAATSLEGVLAGTATLAGALTVPAAATTVRRIYWSF